MQGSEKKTVAKIYHGRAIPGFHEITGSIVIDGMNGIHLANYATRPEFIEVIMQIQVLKQQ